jgi:hypothetical protein
MGAGKINRENVEIIIFRGNLTVFTRLFFLSTKIVDNLWRTVLTLFKSDIFASVLSIMPFFYTQNFYYNINYLDLFPVKIGVCAVKQFKHKNNNYFQV